MAKLARLLSCLIIALFLATEARAAVLLPFTVTLSEPVIVDTTGGVPRIQIDVGGQTRYAAYTAGTGTDTLTFTYSVQSGDVDNDGIALASPIQLNGGSIKDAGGNNAVLTYTAPNTTGLLVNAPIPSGYTAAFVGDTVTNANKSALSFTITSPKTGLTYNYSITSSGGGTALTGSGTLSTTTQTIGGINVTSLPDGILTLSLTLTDSLGGIGAAATDTIPMAVLTANLVGHWTFDAGDISGTIAYDRSGSGYNGTLLNGPVQTTGISSGALSFDGTNDRVTIATTGSLTAPYTVALWASVNNTGATRTFIGSRTTSTYGFDAKFETGTLIHGDIGTGTSWITNNADVSYAYSINTWYHIVYVVSSGNYKIYVNGALAKSATLGAGLPLLFSPTNTLAIGSHGGTAEYFPGKIDDVRIYNTALTSGNVSALYTYH